MFSYKEIYRTLASLPLPVTADQFITATAMGLKEPLDRHLKSIHEETKRQRTEKTVAAGMFPINTDTGTNEEVIPTFKLEFLSSLVEKIIDRSPKLASASSNAAGIAIEMATIIEEILQSTAPEIIVGTIVTSAPLAEIIVPIIIVTFVEVLICFFVTAYTEKVLRELEEKQRKAIEAAYEKQKNLQDEKEKHLEEYREALKKYQDEEEKLAQQRSMLENADKDHDNTMREYQDFYIGRIEHIELVKENGNLYEITFDAINVTLGFDSNVASDIATAGKSLVEAMGSRGICTQLITYYTAQELEPGGWYVFKCTYDKRRPISEIEIAEGSTIVEVVSPKINWKTGSYGHFLENDKGYYGTMDPANFFFFSAETILNKVLLNIATLTKTLITSDAYDNHKRHIKTKLQITPTAKLGGYKEDLSILFETYIPVNPGEILDYRVFDVGQGACTCVVGPNREPLFFVDFGHGNDLKFDGKKSIENVAKKIVEFLPTDGFIIVLTHLHSDHYKFLLREEFEGFLKNMVLIIPYNPLGPSLKLKFNTDEFHETRIMDENDLIISVANEVIIYNLPDKKNNDDEGLVFFLRGTNFFLLNPGDAAFFKIMEKIYDNDNDKDIKWMLGLTDKEWWSDGQLTHLIAAHHGSELYAKYIPRSNDGLVICSCGTGYPTMATYVAITEYKEKGWTRYEITRGWIKDDFSYSYDIISELVWPPTGYHAGEVSTPRPSIFSIDPFEICKRLLLNIKNSRVEITKSIVMPATPSERTVARLNPPSKNMLQRFSQHQLFELKKVLPKLFEKQSSSNSKREQLLQRANKFGCTLHNVAGDGRCFYHAVLYQLQHLPEGQQRKFLRYENVSNLIETTAHYIVEHQIEFQDHIIDGDMDRFIDEMLSGSWAEDVAITALSRALNISLIILRSEGSEESEVTVKRSASPDATIYLGYEVDFHYQALIFETCDGKAKLDAFLEQNEINTVTVNSVSQLSLQPQILLTEQSNVGNVAVRLHTDDGTSKASNSTVASCPEQSSARVRHIERPINSLKNSGWSCCFWTTGTLVAGIVAGTAAIAATHAPELIELLGEKLGL